MSVVPDAVALGSLPGFSTSPLDFPITLTSGEKGVTVHIFYGLDGGASVTGVTVGGDALALISGSSISNGSEHGETWGGKTSTTGSQTVSAAFSGTTGNVFIAKAISATNCDSTTPVNNGNSTSNSSSPIALAMTSPAGDMSTTAMYAGDALQASVSDQTGLAENVDRKTTIGGVNPTHTWTESGFSWSHAVMTGANFKAAAVIADDSLESGRRFVSVP